MKKNNKGFTLVELIVVIVILGILAAILVPALLGYVDKAKEQQDVLSAKSCLTAAQGKLSEMYAADKKLADITKAQVNDIKNMADVKCNNLYIGVTTDSSNKHKAYTIDYVAYQAEDKGTWMIMDDSVWTGYPAKTDGTPDGHTIKTSTATATTDGIIVVQLISGGESQGK